jgi:AraC-like DNA-binding protein
MDNLIDWKGRSMLNRDDVERVSGLRILSAGRKTATPLSRLKNWRTLQVYALVYIIEGHGFFASTTCGEIEVQAGDCFFLFPDENHFYGPRGTKLWKEFWVLFSGSTADHLLEESGISTIRPVVPIIKLRRTGFSRNLEAMVYLYKYRPLDYQIQMSGLLFQSILQVALPQDGNTSTMEDESILHEMKQLLYKNIRNSRKMESYFYLHGKSYHTLRMKFQKLTGQSPRQYWIEMRIQEAKEQLLWSDLSIASISEGLGFTDAQYFSRVFCQHNGCSPRKYRDKFYDHQVE